MRFYIQIFVLGFMVLLTSCTDKNAPANGQSSEQQNAMPLSESKLEDVPGTVATPATKCEGDLAPKIVKGECSGAWSVKKKDGVLNCEFEWKPRVSCPNGMKPLGLQSACYGVTSRPVEGNIKTAEDCSSTYGKYPISPAYKLECCP